MGVAIRSLIIEVQNSGDRLADGVRHGAARQHADQVRAVLGATVDIAVHPVGRNGHAFERLRRKAFLQRFLE